MRRTVFGRCAGPLATLVVAGCIVASAGAFSGWTVVGSPSPATYGSIVNAVAARTATDAWSVGVGAWATSNNTLAEHWNGATWTVVPTPNPAGACQDGNIQWTGNRLQGVATVAANDAWAVGHTCYTTKTLAEHWNGSSWSIVATPSFSTGADGVQNSLDAVAAVSAGNVWAVGFHTASNGAFVTLVEHWNGTSWSVVSSPSPSTTANVLNAVSSTGAADVWAVGSQNAGGTKPLIEHWNGAGWAVVPSPARPAGSVLNGVVAVASNDVWAVGSMPASTGAPLTLAEHWNGSAWSVVPTPNLSTTYGSGNVLYGVSAVASNDVWAVGTFQNASTNYHQERTLTLHWNGLAWSVVASPTPGNTGELRSIAHVPGTTRVIAGGYDSLYNRNIYDGTYTAPRTLVLSG
jgi:hypothetical protein